MWSRRPGSGARSTHFTNPVLGALLNAWTVTGFHRIQSGSPLVFTMGTDVAQNGILQPNGQYTLLVPGATAKDVRRDHSSTADMIAMYFNTAAFVPLASVPRGIYGDARRGLIYGPGDVNTDLAVLRYVRVGSDVRLQLRAGALQRVQSGEFQWPEHDAFIGHVRQNHRGRPRPGDTGRHQGDLVIAKIARIARIAKTHCQNWRL